MQRLPGREVVSAIALFAGACFPWSTPVAALDAEKTVSQFNIQNWTRQNGLPADKINTIIQTIDGYIWLGTQNGAVRFDGREFAAVPVDLPEANGQEIRKLAADRDGGMSFAITSGGFGRYDGQVFSALEDRRLSRPTTNATGVFETRDGVLWTADAHLGLGRWTDGTAGDQFFEVSIMGRILSLCEAPSGRIWIGTAERGLFYWENEKLSKVDDPRLLKRNIFALAADHDGRIWVGTGVGLLCYDASGQPREIPPLDAEVKALLVDRHGVLWAGTVGLGLARYQNGKFTFLRKADGLGSDSLLSLLEDAEGSLWIGTQDGLSQLTDLKFPIFANAEGLVGHNAIFVAPAANGSLWVADAEGVSHFDGRTATNFPGSLFPNQYIRRIFEAGSGEVYVVDGDKNINVLSGDRLVARYANDTWVEAFAEDAESVLVGRGLELLRMRDGKLEPYRFKGDAPPALNWINNLWVAKDGAIWAATNSGVFRLEDGGYQNWSVAEGLPSEKVSFIFEDVDGSVWAGLPAGLARFKDGQIRTITVENGLFDGRIFAIVPDDHGYFWLSSGRGFFRVARASLNDFADGKVAQIRCDAFEGLESVKFTDRNDQGYSGCKTLDGRIWFPTPHGVVMIDPVNFVTNTLPPPVLIQQVLVNGVAWKNTGAAVLKVGDDRLEFFFTALSYISPKRIQIRYQLEGVDSAWLDAGERRSALYANLRPGRYTFKVEACNADGVWNTAAATFGLELPAPFHQTGWFYGLCSLGGVLVLIALYRWKVRLMALHQQRLRQQNELLETKVVARTRELAREHALLRALLDNSPDQIYFKDAQSRFVKASRAQAKNFGLDSPDELIGRSDADFFGDEHARPALADEQEIMRTGQPILAKVEREAHKDGRVTWVLTSKMPLRNEAGAIVGTFGISKGITEIKLAEERLAELNRQFLETSRRAGMAEVATGVLHNVGNVLNSINVSTTLLVEQIAASESAHLAKVCALLRQHETELGPFFHEHSKGRQVLGFLDTLSRQFAAKQATIGTEVEGLRRNVDHIKKIIDMQQNYARVSGIAESVRVDELVEDALRMNAAALVRHEVTVIREYRDRPTLMVEKHKVLQILVNLVRNAKYACDESGRSDKQLILRVCSEEQRAKIFVIDNGVGIPAENLSRIFAHGFTTRKDGHGFGLHSGALAARELRGSLTAQSDGLGCGAMFTLELPLQCDSGTVMAPDRAGALPPAVVQAA